MHLKNIPLEISACLYPFTFFLLLTAVLLKATTGLNNAIKLSSFLLIYTHKAFATDPQIRAANMAPNVLLTIAKNQDETYGFTSLACTTDLTSLACKSHVEAEIKYNHHGRVHAMDIVLSYRQEVTHHSEKTNDQFLKLCMTAANSAAPYAEVTYLQAARYLHYRVEHSLLLQKAFDHKLGNCYEIALWNAYGMPMKKYIGMVGIYAHNYT